MLVSKKKSLTPKFYLPENEVRTITAYAQIFRDSFIFTFWIIPWKIILHLLKKISFSL